MGRVSDGRRFVATAKQVVGGVLLWCVGVSSADAIAGPPVRQPFVHPGIFTSQAELEAIRHRVAAGDPNDPMVTGYQSTMATRFADVHFVPQPVAHVKRGDRKPKDSPTLERDSAMTAYTLTLRWVVVGDTAARDEALHIMNVWADVFESDDGDINRFLDSSWVLAPWCAAGELMKYAVVDGKHAGWPEVRQQEFTAMVRKLSDISVGIFDPKYAPGNWQTSASLGNMEAGIFLNDPALYARARDYQLKNIPKVLLKAGYCNEIFRDAWHGTVSLTGALQAAEVGRHQGDLSIYNAKYDGQADPRLLVCLRWYANPFRGIPVHVPPMGGAKWKPKPWEFVDDAMRSTGGWEMGLNFYQNIEPSSDLAGFKDAVLTHYRPSGQDNALFIESDSLTHGDLSRGAPK